MPSTLRLTIREGCDEPYIDFFIDGVPLPDLLRQAAGPDRACFVEEVLPWPEGRHVDETVLGVPARTRGLPEAYLFICGCGQWMCGCNWVDTLVTDTTITFANFRIRWKEPPLNIAPIVFDRRQYEAEVADLATRIAAWSPPPPRPRVPKPPPPPSYPELHPENWPPT